MTPDDGKTYDFQDGYEELAEMLNRLRVVIDSLPGEPKFPETECISDGAIRIIKELTAKTSKKSVELHVCDDYYYKYSANPFVIARHCSKCGRIMAARERRFWRRLIGLFYDNV